MHTRSPLIDAVSLALEGAGLVMIEATDAVQEADVPCAVIEEREETVTPFGRTLAQQVAPQIRRSLRFGVFAIGKTRRERDDVAEKIENAVISAVIGAGFVDCTLVGVGFTRTKVGTSAVAFAAGQFYDAVYMTPTGSLA